MRGGITKCWTQSVRIDGGPTSVGLGRYPVVTLARPEGGDPRRRARPQGADLRRSLRHRDRHPRRNLEARRQERKELRSTAMTSAPATASTGMRPSRVDHPAISALTPAAPNIENAKRKRTETP